MLRILSGFLLLITCLASNAASHQPPASLEADAVSPTAIMCYWLPAPNATGYKIVRDGIEVATVSEAVDSYKDTGLQPGSLHTYRVEAVYPDGITVASPPYMEESLVPFPDHETKSARTFDVVVMQATSAGWAAAITAAKQGMHVALVEPSNRVGGMPCNGLSVTDLRKPYHLAGMMLDMVSLVKKLYEEDGIKASGFNYSPRIALQAMREMLYSNPNITLFRFARLASVRTETDSNGLKHVTSVQIAQVDDTGHATGKVATLHAKVFIDSTDCGDLAAWAGAPFRLGREPRTPREPHAGVIYYDRANGHDIILPGSTGKGDNRVQSYAYLLVVKDYGKGTNHTIQKPPGYNPAEYVHTPAWLDSWAVTSGKLPDGEYELNQHPQGNDLQGINYKYALDSYRQRRKIEQIYRNHVLGYLYYIETEQGQPQLGLPDDEYRDTGGFPPLLYVREARRILGQQIPEEWDITNAREVVRPNSIGIGDYPMDSHAVQPKVHWNRPDLGEGEYWLYLYTPWHQLPLGILIPQKLDNVWVTMSVSATHVAYGTYRLETQRMEFGEAAGIGAALEVKYHLTAPTVPFRQIQDDLIKSVFSPSGDPRAMIYYYADELPGDPLYREIETMSCRGFDVSYRDFAQNAPTTQAEIFRWLSLMANRAGTQADTSVIRSIASWKYSTVPVTRIQVATLLCRLLRWKWNGSSSITYTDLQAGSVENDYAQTLNSYDINTTLWDGILALNDDKEGLFKPDAPISHSAMIETLYIAQLSLAPLFYDNQADLETVAAQRN